MLAYIVRRLLQLVIVLIGVTVITFLIMFAIPGDPAQLWPARTPRRRRSRPSACGSASTSPSTCSTTSSSGALLRGDLGESYQLQKPVMRDDQGERAQHHPAGAGGRAHRAAGHPLGHLLGPAPVHVLGHHAHHGGAHHLGHTGVRPGRVHAVVLRLQARPAAAHRRRRQRALGDPGELDQLHVAHPAGGHAGPDRGRLHLVHAARLHARGHPQPTTSARRGPRASPRRTWCASTPSRTPSSRS